MIELLYALICLSVFISAWTLGLRIISSEGMILFPLRKFCFSIGKQKQKEIEILIFEKKRKIKKYQLDSYSGDSDIDPEKLEEEIEELEWKSFLVEAWHKPLITCAACMSSFHGMLISIYFMIIVNSSIILIAPFSIFLSVVINVYIWDRLKI